MLSQYYRQNPGEDKMHHLVINYAGLDPARLREALPLFSCVFL
jgi:hypothetical protein